MLEDNTNTDTAVVEEEGEEKEEVISTETSILLEEMAKAGVLYGRKKSKTHPKMKKFIFTTRNGFEVFDLPKTSGALEKASEFLAEKIANRGMIMLVGTNPAVKDLIRKVAKATKFPFVVDRWLGGTFTNFKTLSKRIDFYKNLKADKESGKLDKYTKKERVLIDKKIEKMTRLFGGLEALSRVPDVLFVVDATKHDIAVKEARKVGIPVVAIVNSDTNPETIDYAVPANTSSRTSLEWIFNKLETTFNTPPKVEVVKAAGDDKKKSGLRSEDNSEVKKD
jgi:small subunit ribosomal protein S2